MGCQPTSDALQPVNGGNPMIALAVLLLLLTIAAAIFGFGAIIAAGTGIAQVLFWVFLGMLVVSLFAAAITRGPGVPTTRY